VVPAQSIAAGIAATLLPQLQQAFNSNLNATLLRTSKIFREEEDFWESHLTSWLDEHSLNRGDGRIRFPIRPLLETHPAMQKRLLRRVVQEVKGDLREFGFHHTEILLQLCRSPAANRQLDLPGAVQVEKSYDWVTVTLRPETVEDFTFRISDHGVHPFPSLNHSMEVELLASDLPVEFSHNPNEAIMDLDRISFPLTSALWDWGVARSLRTFLSTPRSPKASVARFQSFAVKTISSGLLATDWTTG
jgi:tRNA(Ile)-lysidine synthase